MSLGVWLALTGKHAWHSRSARPIAARGQHKSQASPLVSTCRHYPRKPATQSTFSHRLSNSLNHYSRQWIVPEPVPYLEAAPPAVRTPRLVEGDLILEILVPSLVLVPGQGPPYPIDLGLRHSLPFPGQGREAGVVAGEGAIHEALVLRYRAQKL